jgi:hypothetical protein
MADVYSAESSIRTNQIALVNRLGCPPLRSLCRQKRRTGRPIALIYFDYGSLDDPQSQPPAGTSVAAQNVSVPFV